MKKKIFFYACFLLIGCFIGINIKEFKSLRKESKVVQTKKQY